MSNSQRDNDVLNFLRHGMEVVNQRLTSDTLGNRSDYVGMSDLAKYSACPRAALSDKVHDELSLKQMLMYSRGHWIEDGIGQSLKACGHPIIRQLEINDCTNRAPIKAHLDFVLFSTSPSAKVRIVEVKSMNTIPDAPYPQHEFQAHGQVSLLHGLWNKPVFTMRDEQGNVILEQKTFPQICQDRFGVAMPTAPSRVSIESWLLCVSMKEAKPFGPYTFAKETFSAVHDLADEFWAFYAQIKDSPEAIERIPYLQAFDPICCVCQHNGNCPKFRDGGSQPQWEAAIAKWETLKAQKSACEAELKELDAAIRQAYLLSGTRDWITAGRYRFRVSQVAGRKSFNKGVLKEELTSLFNDRNIDLDVPSLISSCEREGAPYSRLTVSTINDASAA